MMTPQEIYETLYQLYHSEERVSDRYVHLYDLLQRICSEQAEELSAGFTSLFSRLYAVCKHRGVNPELGDNLRRRLHRVLTRKEQTDEQRYRQDVLHFAHWVREFFKVPLSADFRRLDIEIGTAFTSLVEKKHKYDFTCLCVVVEEVCASGIKVVGDGVQLEVNDEKFGELYPLLNEGDTLHLVEGWVDDGVARPWTIILEPDYLIDVSALTACLRPYGDSPYNYILSQLQPIPNTVPILMGNAANIFMDRCVHQSGAVGMDEERDEPLTPDALYLQSMREAFQGAPLSYCHPDVEVDREYFVQARGHFDRISKVVAEQFSNADIGLRPEHLILEPSFICPTLGLRGRFDVMTDDFRRILELKSGKADGFGSAPKRPKDEHVLQMSLYKEILHFNRDISRAEIDTYLLYSLYPYLWNQRSAMEAVARVLMLRNRIVALEMQLRLSDTWQEMLSTLSVKALNTANMSGRFFEQYLAPQLQTILSPLQNADGVLRSYFCEQMAFLYREHFLSKTDNNRAGSTRGFSRIWRMDAASKVASGDMIPQLKIHQLLGEESRDKGQESRDKGEGLRVKGEGLRVKGQGSTDNSQQTRAHSSSLLNLRTSELQNLKTKGEGLRVKGEGLRVKGEEDTLKAPHSVTRIIFRLPDLGENFIPNFNVGEMVQCYQQTNQHDDVSTSLLLRGYIREITSDYLTLDLTYPQRSQSLFSPTATYIIERDSTDIPMRHAMRGVYAFLGAPQQRQALLLGQRTPDYDDTQTLLGEYPERIADIILRAKCAKDYFLLVGPPGTGKTNVALRSMVHEFLLSYTAGQTTGALLLMAYTHRAVDEICAMLHDLLAESHPGTAYLRIGAHDDTDAPWAEHTLDALTKRCPNRASMRQALASIPIFVGTITTLSGRMDLFALRRFSCAIIDEASQVLEPQLLGLLSAVAHPSLVDSLTPQVAIPKFILIGDHKQLPAVVQQTSQCAQTTSTDLHDIDLRRMDCSLFERLHRLLLRNSCTQCLGYLDVQGRMHPEICDLVNADYYGARLRPVPLAHQVGDLAFSRPPVDEIQRALTSHRLLAINVVPEQMPLTEKANSAEAAVIADIVSAYLYLMQGTDADPLHLVRRIGIIVPFRAQIATVRHALRRVAVPHADAITIDTVECYQGSQRDLIIFGTTIHSPHAVSLLSQPVVVDGTLVDRKLNVAITRARQQFVLVGNRQVLANSPIYRKLWERMERNEEIV